MSDVFADDILDPFNPEEVAQVHEKLEADFNSRDELVVKYIERRSQAYGNVFSAGDTSKADIDFVMMDLATFCRAFEPTFDLDAKKQDLKEGRREVYLRIMKWASLPPHVLLTMYTQQEQG